MISGKTAEVARPNSNKERGMIGVKLRGEVELRNFILEKVSPAKAVKRSQGVCPGVLNSDHHMK
jgi:hypothetical protein